MIALYVLCNEQEATELSQRCVRAGINHEQTRMLHRRRGRSHRSVCTVVFRPEDGADLEPILNVLRAAKWGPEEEAPASAGALDDGPGANGSRAGEDLG